MTIAAVLVSCCAAKDNLTRAPVSPEFRPFEKAVKQYMDLREDQEKKLPKLRDRAEPEEIVAYKSKLREALRTARAHARQGEIFVPSVHSVFRKTILSELKGPGGAPARRTVMSENPKAPGVPGDVKAGVNVPYPADAPVTTLPPSLLLRLPTLPEELEYRFVGRALILRDVNAALIVDYLPNALPSGGET